MVIRAVKKYEVEFAKSAKPSLKDYFQVEKLLELIKIGFTRLVILISTFISASINFFREADRSRLVKVGAVVLVSFIFLNSVRLVFFAQTARKITGDKNVS